jgi:hypothetical protein
MNRYDIALKKSPPKRSVPVPEKKVEQAKRGLSQEQKQGIITEYMSTSGGRERLATSMVEPFRQRLNARSFARRLFIVDQLPQVAIQIYNKDDPSATAYVIDNNDQVQAINLDRVILPALEISSNPSIPLSELRERNNRGNQIERVQDRALRDFVNEEETKAIAIFNAARSENINLNSIDDLTTRIIANVISTIERLDLRAANILMNNQDFIIARSILTRDALDIETNREIIETGRIATILGVQINVSSNVPLGEIYVLAEPRFVGVLSEISLECLSADDPAMRRVGFSFFEQIGMGCLNSNCVKKIIINRNSP